MEQLLKRSSRTLEWFLENDIFCILTSILELKFPFIAFRTMKLQDISIFSKRLGYLLILGFRKTGNSFQHNAQYITQFEFVELYGFGLIP